MSNYGIFNMVNRLNLFCLLKTMAAIIRPEVDFMGSAIGLVVSAIGAYFCDVGFCTLYTFVSISIALHDEWNRYQQIKLRLQ